METCCRSNDVTLPLPPLWKGGEFRARSSRSCALVALLGLIAVAGCERAGTPTSQPATITEQFTDGPVTVTLRVSPKDVTTVEPFSVELLADAPADVDIAWPKIEGTLGGFRVTAQDRKADIPRVGQPTQREWRFELTLESDLAGERKLPEMLVTYTPRETAGASDRSTTGEPSANAPTTAPSADAATRSGTIRIPERMLTIRSRVGDEYDPRSYADIKGPVAVAPPPPLRWPWYVAGGAALVLPAAVWLLVRWQKRVRPVVSVAPDVWAREQLDALEAEDLPTRGLVREFYYRLTDIVRQYIERRFALAAPEQTTREFLATAQQSTALDSAQQRLLRDFLVAGDLVKYARFEPAPPDIARALDTGRTFVLQTAERPTPPTIATEGPEGAAA